MDAPTLGSIFTRHLGFPATGKAQLSAEAFAERLEERTHGLDREARDPSSWVEHFFELEHPFESREQEFQLAAQLGEKGEAVLEFSLGEQEFVVIDNEEEVVVVSSGGSIVLGRTSELTSKLRAAELPASRQSSPNAPFRSGGERAFHVTRSGTITTLDARLVAQAIRSAPARTEPLARIASAPSRLAAFQPVTRVTPPAPVSQPAREIASVARADKAGAAPKVIVVERGGTRQESGERAKWWHRLASTMSDGGRLTSAKFGGASAVAVGRETYAVKAGGVTAIVQRPAQGIGRRLDAASRRSEVFSEQRTQRAAPQWVREALDERPRGHGYWVQPSETPAPAATAAPAAARPSWVNWAMEQAREARSRARTESRGLLDPRPMMSAASVAPTAIEAFSAPAQQQRMDLRAAPDAASIDLVLPQFRVVEGGEVSFRGPISSAGAIPATTLRALYTGLERTAEREGYRLPSISLSSAQAPDALPSLDVEAVPMAARAARSDRGQRAAAVYSLPFAADQGVHIGPDLGHALEVMLGRRLDESPRRSAPITFPRAALAAAGLAAAPTSELAVATGINIQASEAPALDALVAPEAVDALPPMSSGAPQIRVSSQAWVNWAVKNSALARAHEKGSLTSLASLASMPLDDAEAVAAPTLGPGADLDLELPTTLAPQAASESIGSYFPSERRQEEAFARAPRFPSLFIRFDAETGAAGPRARLPMDVDGPELGLFAVPVGVDAGELDASRPTADFSSQGPGVRPTIPGPDGRPRSFIEGTWMPGNGTGSPVSVRLTPLLLQDVNARRAPDPVAMAPRWSQDLDDSTEEVIVPVPLWVQMSDQSAPTFAAPESEQNQINIASPYIAGSTVNAGGTMTMPSQGGALTARPGALSMSRPGSEGFSIRGGASAPVPGAAAPAPRTSLFGGGGLLGFAGASAAPTENGLAASAPDMEPVEGDTGPDGEPVAPAGPPAMAAGGKSAAGLLAGSRAASAVVRSAAPSVPHAKAENSSYFPSERNAQEAAKKARTQAQSTSSAAPSRESTPVGTWPSEQRATSQRRASGGYLRFRFPSTSRWWAGTTSTVDLTGDTSRGPMSLASSTSAPAMDDLDLALPEVSAKPGSLEASAGSVARADRSSDYVPLSSPFAGKGKRSARSLDIGLDDDSYLPSERRAAELAARAPGDNDMAYVAVNANGESTVMNGVTAAQVAKARKSGSVDMTVVAAMAPQAPSLEDMATAGHERPHAKGKKESAPKAGAKSDAMSLQGTVDSLAQRIYHRIKRRLASDRERFGG